MSDFEDELLALAGGIEGKKKGTNKKRKADRMDIDSERDPVESEADEVEDPYPLEGKYKDELDRRSLLSMTEIQREQILEARAEERQQLQNAKQIADLVRQQRNAAKGNQESVSKAAKRQHTARGATKEKASKLDELKAKRRAKDDKKRPKSDGSPQQHRERSSSPQDMDISDSESEDGQITKREQEDERLLSLGGRKDTVKEEVEETPCVLVDLEKCRLTRDVIIKHSVKPWFEDYVKGAWVRYLIGHEPEGGPVYRICQISNLAPDFVKPYRVDGKMLNQAFELQHGKSTKVFNMDKVSNGSFLQKEFDRLMKTCTSEEVKLPSKQELERKVDDMRKLLDQPMTENDITVMLARKNQLQASGKEGLTMLERSRLKQERTLAIRRQDYAEVAEIDLKLEEADKASPQPVKQQENDAFARVNERNRKANVEAVRRAEHVEAERRRKERRLGARSGTPIDPSARLKTLPRTFNAASSPSPQVISIETTTSTTTTTVTIEPSKTFEDSMIKNVEIDLGDF